LSPPAPRDNFALLLDAAERRAPSRTALVEGRRRVSYAELVRRAAGVARWLAARGVAAGERVALALPNGIAFAVALYGALRAGVTVTPLNPQLTAEERARILDDFRPRVVIDAVPDAEDDLPTVARVDAPALVLYTSGSTGRPKGAMLSHTALAAGNRAWAGPVMGLTADDRILAVLPLSHSYGINGALLAPLLAGASSVLVERFSPEAVVAAVRAHAVTVLPCVATMFRRILDAPGWAAADLASVRVALSGAAPCPWPLAEEWRARTGIRILRGYGMTELFRPLSYRAGDPRDHPDCIGRPVPGVEVRLIDEAGADVPPGEVGELLIRSDAAMDGYVGQPEETAAAFAEGWFRTGDLARMSGDGFVAIVGRKKELILRGGYSVFPPEIEAALAAHPAVAEAAVVGIPHPDLGEEVAAFVTLRAGAHALPEDIAAWCKERVAGYKCPRTVHVLAALPKTATGKVLKSHLVATLG
jgi:long-chain acyl-CoA synthetase